MFGFIKKMFIGLLSPCTISFDESLVSNLKGPIKCAPLDNQPCQTRLTVVNVTSGFFIHLLLVLINIVEVVTLLVIHILEKGVNETRILVQHKSCACRCGLNESVCNSKQKWNHDECRSECKELDN